MSSVLIPPSRRSSATSQRAEFSDIEIAWLAGLLEGEGTFFSIKSTVKNVLYLYPHISVNMTDQDVIARAAAMFGTKAHGPYINGHLKSGDTKRPYYRAGVTGKRAIAFMRALLPYMGLRRSAKIAEVIKRYEDQLDQDERRRQWSRAQAAKRRRNHLGQLVAE